MLITASPDSTCIVNVNASYRKKIDRHTDAPLVGITALRHLFQGVTNLPRYTLTVKKPLFANVYYRHDIATINFNFEFNCNNIV